ncbi:RnfABCDGE type electron transport complex subunit A [Candidatus Nomurabacteria bacterium]|nr:RnfABCDGE type electron transport complex subunit A [Eubacteriales bacterium]NCU27036.1 RnfABCDGE type electron transport complex subunit A [Candidatus Nomurabacteria bacterium]
MKEMFIILFSVIFVDNFVLSKFLGICPFLGVSKKLNTAMGMSMAVILVMGMSSAITYPINTFLLVPNGLEYLRTIVFILVIAALVQSIETIIKKLLPPLYEALGVYLPLITTNCAVLGVVLLNISNSLSFWGSVVNGVGAGIGFMLAMVLFAGVRARLEKADVPKFLRGLPITLIAASIVSVSFMGFKGIIEKLFA